MGPPSFVTRFLLVVYGVETISIPGAARKSQTITWTSSHIKAACDALPAEPAGGYVADYLRGGLADVGLRSLLPAPGPCEVGRMAAPQAGSDTNMVSVYKGVLSFERNAVVNQCWIGDELFAFGPTSCYVLQTIISISKIRALGLPWGEGGRGKGVGGEGRDGVKTVRANDLQAIGIQCNSMCLRYTRSSL